MHVREQGTESLFAYNQQNRRHPNSDWWSSVTALRTFECQSLPALYRPPDGGVYKSRRGKHSVCFIGDS